MRLAAGLRPDPLGELKHSPGPLAAIGGRVLLLKGRESEMAGKGGRKGRSGKVMGGVASFWLYTGLHTALRKALLPQTDRATRCVS